MKKPLLYSFVLFATFAVACSKSSSPAHTIKYTVSGTARLSVTYTDKNLASVTAGSVDSSWTYSFSSNADGQVVHLAVTSVDGSAVAGRIYIDNQQSTQDNSASGSISISAQIP